MLVSLLFYISSTKIDSDLHFLDDSVRNMYNFEYFHTISERNCSEIEYLKRRSDLSIIHCSMLCLTHPQCLALSFDTDIKDCRLLGFLEANCSRHENETQVTLQRNQTEETCLFSSKEKGEVSLIDACGQSVLMLPFVFDIKGLGKIAIGIIPNYSSGIQIRIKEMVLITVEIRGGQQARVVFMVFGTNRVYNLQSTANVDIRDPLAFWIQVEKQESGTLVRMGEGHAVGRDILFNEFSLYKIESIKNFIIQNPEGQFELKFYWKD